MEVLKNGIWSQLAQYSTSKLRTSYQKALKTANNRQ